MPGVEPYTARNAVFEVMRNGNMTPVSQFNDVQTHLGFIFSYFVVHYKTFLVLGKLMHIFIFYRNDNG